MNLIKDADRLQNLDPSQNIYYRAVVENNNDGGEGKVQVRIIGVHPDNKVKVPTENLPWAEVIGSTSNYGGMSGIGSSAVPLQGSWVWVFFDGGDWNLPVVVGLIVSSSNEAADSSVGFQDPAGEYPRPERLGKPDVANLARGEVEGTLISSIKISNQDTGIPTLDTEIWEEEEEESSKAEYPKNVVTETVTGNIIEMDESNGGRMHWFHNSGTYWEVISNGNYILKVVSDYRNIVDGDTYRYNKGSENHTVQGDSAYKIDGDSSTTIGGDLEKTIFGNFDLTVDGFSEESHAGGLEINGGPEISFSASIIKLN